MTYGRRVEATLQASVRADQDCRDPVNVYVNKGSVPAWCSVNLSGNKDRTTVRPREPIEVHSELFFLIEQTSRKITVLSELVNLVTGVGVWSCQQGIWVGGGSHSRW